MTGHVAIVTGADNGVGLEVARSLCETGNDVILACKDEAQTKIAIDKIKEQAPNALVSFMQVGWLLHNVPFIVATVSVVQNFKRCSRLKYTSVFVVCHDRSVCHLWTVSKRLNVSPNFTSSHNIVDMATVNVALHLSYCLVKSFSVYSSTTQKLYFSNDCNFKSVYS